MDTPSVSSSDSRSKKHAARPMKRTLVQGFASDIGRLVCVFGILVAIIITLVRYNGRPQPSWHLSVNLNSLVALLTTILRASMLAVVSEGL